MAGEGEVPAVSDAPSLGEPETIDGTAARSRRHIGRNLGRGALALLIGLVLLAVAAVIVVDSGIGHRFVAQRIAQLAPASGLRIDVGRIEGSLYGKAKLHDVTLADPRGVFARIPQVDLDWKPLNWFRSGLDVRELVAHRGVLSRLPQLNPGDPDAPILPNFDIRIDRLQVEDLRIAQGVLGSERRLNLLAKADIRKGRALLRLDGRAGVGDRVFALLDTAPASDKFDLRLDYSAPKGGLLAEMAGTDSAMRALIVGKGGWTRWNGALLVNRDDAQFAALKLTNRAGRYGFLGQVVPGDLIAGLPRQAAGERVSVSGAGTLRNSVLDGSIGVTGAAFRANADGAVDLANNGLHNLLVRADLTRPDLFGPDMAIEGGHVGAILDGAFRDLAVTHESRVASVRSGSLRAERLTLNGTATYDGERWTAPLNFTAARIVTGDPTADQRLVNARAQTVLTVAGTKLWADRVAIDLPGLAARLAVRGDLATGGYGVAGPVVARGLAVPNLGLADADAKIVLGFGDKPWFLSANFAGRMARVDNDTLTSVAGTNVRFSGGVSLGAGRPILFQRARLDASKLTLQVSGQRLANGNTTVKGSGRSTDYGPFQVDASMTGAGLRAELVFADPLPAAGLKDVRIALAPIAEGFRIETRGGSSLGSFDGVLNLFSKPGGATTIAIDRLDVSQTRITGNLALAGSAVSGNLALAGGGLDGTVALAPRGGGQGFDVALTARDARFAGAAPVVIGEGQLAARGFIAHDHSTIEGNLYGRGIGIGSAYIGRIAARAQVNDGRGQVTAALAGRRGSRFDLQLVGNFAPGQVDLLAQGDFAGRRIAMPRRAVLVRDGAGWRLERSQIDFGGGRAIASGRLGGAATEIQLGLADMPLSLSDAFGANLGLGGVASGLIDYRQVGREVPTGRVAVQVKGLTRSGLVLTSRPVDMALVGTLSATALEMRGAISEGGQRRGRVQARITGLPADGGLVERLSAGRLFGQLRYSGPADALWRLAALETFDLTGPLSIGADMTGTIANPQINGSLASDSLRLQSALTGTDVQQVAVRGSFAGSRLQLSSFSGTAGDGRISGAGTVDLSNLGERGPSIDLRMSAQQAQLLGRPDMAATITGPLRIVSDGIQGTIAGRVKIDKARWRLGGATAAAQLPQIRTREINGEQATTGAATASAPWRYLIDADGNNRITVRGMGLDSEWGADIKLRGTTDAPAISGRADLVRGGYEFAGKRFDLSRGRIAFDGGSPPDPRLDIVAEGEATGVTARITVGGTAFAPEIRFSSTPALPEEELLSRILFGNSITNISAPEALQLGAALASLRGGGGLDPINKLRSAIGLDRLRIISADAATGRGTGIAAGKYFGRRLYAEIITDGRGYSATQLEFRVTSWLSLLASVSTVGRESANVKVSKDY